MLLQEKINSLNRELMKTSEDTVTTDYAKKIKDLNYELSRLNKELNYEKEQKDNINTSFNKVNQQLSIAKDEARQL